MNEEEIAQVIDELLVPPQLSVSRQDETYMYGVLIVQAADIIMAKHNLETNKAKAYIKAIEDIELQWEFLGFETKDSVQIRKYRKPV